MANSNEGTTAALSNEQARRRLEASPQDTLKGVRDPAILALTHEADIAKVQEWEDSPTFRVRY
ncbi:MAG TPA: hypothetical protein VFU48_00825 [Nitrospira sp.]|nr:hypothetical protein [Nitrospira sp.]